LEGFLFIELHDHNAEQGKTNCFGVGKDVCGIAVIDVIAASSWASEATIVAAARGSRRGQASTLVVSIWSCNIALILFHVKWTIGGLSSKVSGTCGIYVAIADVTRKSMNREEIGVAAVSCSIINANLASWRVASSNRVVVQFSQATAMNVAL